MASEPGLEMLYKFSVTAGFVVLLLTGFLHRSWTDYWQSAPALAEAAARIQQVPLTVGTWRGQPMDLDTEQIAAAGYAGCVWRRYEDSATGMVLSMLLVCGPPG